VGETTRVHRYIEASRERVYAAFLDADAVSRWKSPEGMSAHVEELDARPGGRIRVSLTYDDGEGAGKTSGDTDTYRGRFVELVPPESIVEVLEFVTADPTLRGLMRIEITLREENGGTLLEAVHEGLPAGVAPEDNELGWEMSLAKLAALVEEPVGDATTRASGPRSPS
jgi:uncharacterized protein YndB with AHSA1/START domain